jgi:hypothetical protein
VIADRPLTAWPSWTARSKPGYLPHDKTSDEFNFAFRPDLNAGTVRDLATLGSSEPNPPGIGKPCSPSPWPSRQAAFSVYFTTLMNQVLRFRVAEATVGSTGDCGRTSGSPFCWLTRSDTSRWTGPKPAGLLTRLRRDERGSMIITSNKKPSPNRAKS